MKLFTVATAALLLNIMFADAARSQDHVYLTRSDVAAIKAKVKAGEAPWKKAFELHIRKADRALSKRPRSVVDNGAPHGARDGDPHKAGTDRKLIKDVAQSGDREDAQAFYDLSEWVRDLGVAYGLTGNDTYARKAIDLIYYWTLNPKTYMAPIFKDHAPHNKGNANGLPLFISSSGSRLVFGASFVRHHPYWTSRYGARAEADFEAWLTALLKSVKANPYNNNNHYVRWMQLRTVLSAYLNDQKTLKESFALWRSYLGPQGRINHRGELPLESKRKAGIHYSMITLHALTLIAEIARLNGVNLYDYEDGRGQVKAPLRRAYDFMAPFVSDPNFPRRWKAYGKSESNKASEDVVEFAAPFELAYSYWKDKTYLNVVRSAGRPLVSASRNGPHTLLFGNRFDRAGGGNPKRNEPPVVSILSPDDEHVFAAPADVTIEAAATDDDGSVVRVEFHVDGKKIGDAKRRPFAYNWPGVKPGSYRVTATAVDDKAAQTTSRPITIRVAGRVGGAIAEQRIPVARVRASSSQSPNVPSNTLDGKTATRWAAKGEGEWVRYDLDGSHILTQVRIAWYRGDKRRASFKVEASKDGRTWKRIFRGTSSGTEADLERYDVADTEAKHVRVVGQGNTENQWNSVTEVVLLGRETSETASARLASAALSEASEQALEHRPLDLHAGVPTSFTLEPAYPNPFNPATTIRYHLPEAAEVTVSVYNVAGQHVATLVNGKQQAGVHEVRWDSRDAASIPVTSGLYFYRITAGSSQQTRKMLLLK